MKIVSVSELKNDTSAIVRGVSAGRPVVVMKHGRLCAAVIRISEQDLDQLLFEESPLVRHVLQEALDDLKHKRSVTLKDYLRGKRSC